MAALRGGWGRRPLTALRGRSVCVCCVVVAQAVNNGGDKFSVSGAGVVAVTGTLAVSGAATISGVLTSSAGVTVIAGGLSVTAGGLQVGV